MQNLLELEALAPIDTKDHVPFVPFPQPLGGRPQGNGEISKWIEGYFDVQSIGALHVVPWGAVADSLTATK